VTGDVRDSGTTPPDTGTARVAIVGEGALAREIARNLGLANIPATLHRPEEFWSTLHLAELQDCYCAVAAGADHATRHRLNRLCQVASVEMVCVNSGPQGIVIEAFPFGSDTGCACLDCEPSVEDAATGVTAPDPIAESVAGALAAAAALHCAGRGAWRLHIPEITDSSLATGLRRRTGCPSCAAPWRAPRVIRTRNRWLPRASLAGETAALAGQAVRLSEALVTACECSRCGNVPALVAHVNLPAPMGGVLRTCPQCGGETLRVEAREVFGLGELIERFGDGAVPVKFAVAEIAGTAVCFDLESARAPRRSRV
jgi:hypothetical protein